jgi:hypothetical protein
VLVLVLAVACADPPPRDVGFRAWFDALRARVDRGDESSQSVHAGYLRALPIVRIELERSQVYDFTSLTIVFDGGERATRQGGMADWPNPEDTPFSAEVPFHEIAHLCWLIESLDLPQTSTSWRLNVSHAEQRTIRWTTRDGRSVELSDYGLLSPPAFDALAAAVENTARRLTWTSTGEREDGAPPR